MRGWIDLRDELASLKEAYPAFVTQRVAALPAGEIPVFVFHTIEPEPFARQLDFLKSNRYRAVSLDEYGAILEGRVRGTGREVLLTVDDARSSLWRYGLPLLKEYDCRAVVFAIPGWTPDEPATPRSTLEDVRRGACASSAVAALDAKDSTLCSWSELRALQASGHVDVESHTWLHRRVFVSAQLKGFIVPNGRLAPYHGELGAYLAPERRAAGLDPADYFGLPLFEMRAVLEAIPAWRLRRTVADECRQAFEALRLKMHDTGWQRELAARLSTRLTTESFERASQEECVREIESEIVLARDELRTRLGRPDAGGSLCIPFSLGSKTATGIARRLGVRFCFGGARRGRPANRPGGDSLDLVRIKSDFLPRLPGKGRKSLPAVYLGKVTRRLRGEAPY